MSLQADSWILFVLSFFKMDRPAELLCRYMWNMVSVMWIICPEYLMKMSQWSWLPRTAEEEGSQVEWKGIDGPACWNSNHQLPFIVCRPRKKISVFRFRLWETNRIPFSVFLCRKQTEVVVFVFHLQQTNRSCHFPLVCEEPAICLQPCLAGPVDYLFASRHKRPRFKSPGGDLWETGILLLAMSRYIDDPDVIDNFCGLIWGGLHPEPSLGPRADNVIIPLDLTQLFCPGFTGPPSGFTTDGVGCWEGALWRACNLPATMSHSSSGLPVCFPSQGTHVRIPWGGLMWNRDSSVSMSRYKFHYQYIYIYMYIYMYIYTDIYILKRKKKKWSQGNFP